MFNKIKQTLKEQAENLGETLREQAGNLGDTIREQADHLNEAAKEKINHIIEDWLAVFPKLGEHDLRVSSFGYCMGLSPSLDVELLGDAAMFDRERIQKILDEHKDERLMSFVFKAIRTAYDMHSKVGQAPFDIILVRLSIKIVPEIKVYLGQPLLT